jgi:putative peptide zinc metalloprotease protein
MSGAFHSDAWYRVEHLMPRLAGQARVHRQRFRGSAWYVLNDPASGRLHRFTPSAWLAISLMDGQHSVDAIWRELAARLGDDAPSQDDLLELLSRLYGADLLLADVAPDVAEVLERGRKQRRQRWVRNIANPMSIRLPLWDPDRFLTLTLPWVGWLFSPLGLLLWAALVLPALVSSAAHWTELTGNLSDRVLAFDNLLLLAVVFPLVKLWHELAHGWAVKRGGGEVHEMGLMFLLFAPVPYVDASASTAFRSKGARAGVAAAGMLAETGLAALALGLWLVVEPGLVRSIAFNVMLVAGVSTLVFNANPLLRYDGYFILCDWIEMPNLGQRATAWWAWLAQFHAFGARQAERPDESPAEARILWVYGALSWVYRMAVVIGIALFVAEQFFVFGVLLALWGVASGVVWPLLKGLNFVVSSPVLVRQRNRAMAVTFGSMAVLAAVLMMAPAPLTTFAEGVVWVNEQAELRAGTEGRVQHLHLASGRQVQAGQTVADLEDAELVAEHAVQQARVQRLEVQVDSAMTEDRAKAVEAASLLVREQQALDRLQERMGQLVIKAGASGRLLIPRATDAEGRYLQQGEQLGFVLDGQLRRARVVVPQGDIGLVRHRLRQVRVKLADSLSASYDARILREVPGGSDRLPSAALSVAAGGRHAVDPADEQGTKTLNRVFQFELELPESVGAVALGTRVYVRFEHEPEPLGAQWWRRIRQLFLSRFDV